MRASRHPYHRGAALIASVVLALAAAWAAAQPSIDEAGVRAALTACVQAWNRHDPQAFGDTCLTEDVWFSEADDSFYQRDRGRTRVLGMFDYMIRSADLQWEVARIQALPDGAAAVQMKQRIGILPRTGDRYAKTFDSDPTIARLRRDGGAWKVYFFTSHAGWARSLLQALEKPAAAAAAPVAAPTDARVPPGTEPPAYSVQFGVRSESCFSCHGRRPIVSEDGDRGWTVVVAARARPSRAASSARSACRAAGAARWCFASRRQKACNRRRCGYRSSRPEAGALRRRR